MPNQIPLVNTDEPESLSCATCAACCCRLQVFFTEDTGIPFHMTEEDEWGGLAMRRSDDGWCVALDRNTMLCSIYSKRPQACRDYDLGGDDCLIERTHIDEVYL